MNYEYKHKTFDEYYDEAIIKPQHEAYTAKVNKITFNVFKYIIIGVISIKLVLLFF